MNNYPSVFGKMMKVKIFTVTLIVFEGDCPTLRSFIPLWLLFRCSIYLCISVRLSSWNFHPKMAAAPPSGCYPKSISFASWCSILFAYIPSVCDLCKCSLFKDCSFVHISCNYFFFFFNKSAGLSCLMHLNCISSDMAAYIRKDTEKLCVYVTLDTLLFLNSY